MMTMTATTVCGMISSRLKQIRWQQLLLFVLVVFSTLSICTSHRHPSPSVSFVHKHPPPAIIPVQCQISGTRFSSSSCIWLSGAVAPTQLGVLLQLRGGESSDELPEEHSDDEEDENAGKDLDLQERNQEVEDDGADGKAKDEDVKSPKPEAAQVEIVMEMDEDEGSATPVEETDAPVDSLPTSPSEPLPTETVWSVGDGTVDDKSDATEDVSSPPPPEQTTFTTEAVMDDPTIDENDSSAFVDRMELADDEGETTEVESETTAVPVLSGGEAAAASVSTTATTMEAPPQKSEVIIGKEISKDMEKVLINELRYTKSEVAAMKPNHAAIAIDKRLRRPWEGMPPSWYKSGSKPAEARGVPKILPKIVVPAIVGAAIVKISFNEELDLSGRLSSLKRNLAPATTVKSTTPIEDENHEVSVKNDVPEPTSSMSLLPASDPLPANEHVNALGEPHAHSIKPGVAHPSDEDELDNTWLDKAITAVERKLKSVFSGKK